MWMWFLGYSFLFLVIGFVFYLTLDKPRLKDWYWYIMVLWGGVSLWVTLMIQPPIQLGYNSLVNPTQISSVVLKHIAAFPLALISGVVQEILKALPIFIWWYYLVKDREAQPYGKLLGYSLAVGVGFGLWEAFLLAAWPLAQFGAWHTMAVYERFYAIAFHVSATALVAYGIWHKKPIRFLTLAIILHTLVNFGAIMYSTGLLQINVVQSYATGISLVTWVITYSLWNRIKKHKITTSTEEEL